MILQQRYEELLGLIRPNAVGLVDGFDLADKVRTLLPYTIYFITLFSLYCYTIKLSHSIAYFIIMYPLHVPLMDFLKGRRNGPM